MAATPGNPFSQSTPAHPAPTSVPLDDDDDILMDYDDEDEQLATSGAGAAVSTTAPTTGDAMALDPLNPAAEASADDEVQPEKVYLHGVDNLNTAAVKSYASEHFPEHEIVKLEWIDDSSCCLVYSSAEVASAALVALTLPSHSPSVLAPLVLRPAKPSPTYTPDATLNVRMARPTDRKERGARERSRYYLFHPEEDRGEIRERQRRRPRGRSDRDGSEERDYERRYYDSREHDRRRDRGEAAGYTEDMYDDDAPVRERRGARRRSGGRSRSRSRGARRDRRTRSPSAGSYNARDRDRSRSPRRNRGKELFPLDAPRREKKELFPQTTKAEGRAAMDSITASQPLTAAPRNSKADVDLFADKMRERKELFPELKKTSAFNSSTPEPRKELFSDRKPNSGRELFSSSPSTTAFNPFATSSTSAPPSAPSRNLADRISLPPKSLAERISFGSGSGNDGGDGIQIKGAAKSGFASDDLFAQKMMSAKGEGLMEGGGRRRGGARRRAEDLFET